MSDFPITIFHNPMCGTSRNTLALLRERGFQPDVVEARPVDKVLAVLP